MTAWTSDELGKIAAAEELEIASVRRDGTLRNPVTIWVVRHGDGADYSLEREVEDVLAPVDSIDGGRCTWRSTSATSLAS
jgi:hypothetical protein